MWSLDTLLPALHVVFFVSSDAWHCEREAAKWPQNALGTAMLFCMH
jgi:hypothetical protein